MADDIRLVIGVEQSGLLKAITNTESLEGKVKKLSSVYARQSTALNKQSSEYKRYNKAITKLAKDTNYSKKELLDYGKALRADEKATKKAKEEKKKAAIAVRDLAAEERKAAKAVRDLAAEERKAAKAARDLAAEERKAAKATKELANEEERLKIKFVAGHNAMNIYSKEVNDLGLALKKGIITTDQQTAAVARLNTQMKAGTGAFASAGKGMQQTARKTNQLGVMMQQTGYQVGDFAVQVGSGQNVMVAFGQQATQLVGTMAMFAKTTKLIALFSGLGIAIPVITGVAAAIMRTRGASEDFSDATFDVNEAVKSASEELKEYRKQIALLASDYKTIAEVGLEDQIRNLTSELTNLTAKHDAFKRTRVEPQNVQIGSINYDRSTEMAFQGNIALQEEAIRLKRVALNQLVAERDSLNTVKKLLGEINPLILEGRSASLEKGRTNRQAIIDMQSELALQEQINKFGEDSLETVRYKAQQEAISNNLTTENARKYVDLAVLIHLAKDGAQATAEAMQRQSDSMALHLEYAARQAQITADNAAAVQKIKDSMAKDTQSQERQLELSELRVSVLRQVAGAEDALAAKIAEYARADHAAQLIKQGILGNNLRIQMAVYDALVLQLKAEEDLKRSQKATKEFAEAFAKAIMNVDFSKAVAGATVLETKMRGVWEAMKGAAEFAIRSKSVGRGRGNASGPTAEDMAGTFAGQLAAQDAFTSYEDDKPSGGSNAVFEDAFEKLTKELSRRKELLSLSKERAVVTRAIWSLEDSLGKSRAKYSAEEIKALVEKNIALKKTEDALEEVAAQQKELTDFIGSSMETAMMGIVDGTLSVEDAFKSMAREIIKELYRVLVVQEMVAAAKEALDNRGGIVSVIKSILPLADGGAFSGGSQIQAYANGGVVNSPTTFPMSGGQTGLMGEAGPEAIMPLKRGANGKLGVQMEGGRSGDVININQSFNFQANGDDTVKKLIAQAAPKIADMAKASVIDSRRRGGSTKAAFG